MHPIAERPRPTYKFGPDLSLGILPGPHNQAQTMPRLIPAAGCVGKN